MTHTDGINRTEMLSFVKVGNYSVNEHDAGTEIAFNSATALTCFLPSVSEVGNGFTVLVRNEGSGILTIDPSGGEMVDGATTATLAQADWLWLRSDGTSWESISRFDTATDLDEKVKVSASDTTAGFLNDTVVAGNGINTDIQTPSGDESLVIAVDAGVNAGQIVQLDGTGRLPAVDGSQLTGLSDLDEKVKVSATDAVAGFLNDTVVSGNGITTGIQTLGGDESLTIAVDAGVSPNQIVQLDGVGRLPAVDGSQLTGVGTVTQVDTGVGLTGGPITGTGMVSADLATQAEAEAGTDNTKLMTPLRTEQAVAAQVIAAASQDGFRNRLINGDFRIAQRGLSFDSTFLNDNDYTLDRWQWQGVAGAPGRVTISQDNDTPNGTIKNSLKVNVTTADPTVDAGDYYAIVQNIEGYNIEDMGFDTADAKEITLSFWVKSPKMGLHSVAFTNNAGNRGFAANYEIDAANTWRYRTVTFEADKDVNNIGVWEEGSNLGLRVCFPLMAGSNFRIAPGAWPDDINPANTPRASQNQQNLMDSDTNNFFLANVQLELGNKPTAFEKRAFSQELDVCCRYFQKSFPQETAPGVSAGVNGATQWPCAYNGSAQSNGYWVDFKKTMRATPTITLFNPSAANAEVRNLSQLFDCFNSGTSNPSTNGFAVNTDGDQNSIAGLDAFGVHWTASAEF